MLYDAHDLGPVGQKQNPVPIETNMISIVTISHLSISQIQYSKLKRYREIGRKSVKK